MADVERRKRLEIARRHLPVLIEQDEDGVFIVSVPTLRGCRSYGYTIGEAMQNIAEAAILCLQDEQPTPGAGFVGVRDLEIVAWAQRRPSVPARWSVYSRSLVSRRRVLAARIAVSSIPTGGRQ